MAVYMILYPIDRYRPTFVTVYQYYGDNIDIMLVITDCNSYDSLCLQPR